MNREVKIQHELGEVILRPAKPGAARRLRAALQRALDEYAAEDRIPADVLHREVRESNPERYGTPGYYLAVYRYRADLTQAELARRAGVRQHHVSEMERNLRPIGKAMAHKFARILKCEYRRLL
jgi:DNA-binding XRE family transcriptional regulator